MNVYGYMYELNFISRVWIHELYMLILSVQLPSPREREVRSVPKRPTRRRRVIAHWWARMLVWTLDDGRAVGLVRRDLPSTYNLPWFLVMVKQLVNMSVCTKQSCFCIVDGTVYRVIFEK
jgi:hypothetical protein